MSELFQTLVFPCPACGADVRYRANLEHPCSDGAPAVRCPACGERIERRRIFIHRLRRRGVEGVSWDCEACGWDNFTAGLPGACRHCGSPNE